MVVSPLHEPQTVLYENPLPPHELQVCLTSWTNNPEPTLCVINPSPPQELQFILSPPLPLQGSHLCFLFYVKLFSEPL